MKLLFRIFFLLTSLMMCFKINGQENNDARAIKQVYDSCLFTNSIEPLEKFYNSNYAIKQNDTIFLSNYYGLKIKVLANLLSRKVKVLSKNEFFLSNDFKLYDEAIERYVDLCYSCGICALIHKYKFYNEFKIDSQYKEHDKKLIFDAGYKGIKKGNSFQLQYMYSNWHFIGGEYYFKAIHEPSYKIKNTSEPLKQPNLLCRQSYDFIATYPSFGFNYNPANKNLQLFFNPLSLINPIFLKPLQTGVQFSDGEKIFFYRPEIGFGAKGFHVSTGYNVVFRKHLRPHLNRWAFSLGFTYVRNIN